MSWKINLTKESGLNYNNDKMPIGLDLVLGRT